MENKWDMIDRMKKNGDSEDYAEIRAIFQQRSLEKIQTQ